MRKMIQEEPLMLEYTIPRNSTRDTRMRYLAVHEEDAAKLLALLASPMTETEIKRATGWSVSRARAAIESAASTGKITRTQETRRYHQVFVYAAKEKA